jgi:hypothetical protein
MIYAIPYVLLVILLGFLAILIEQKKEDEAFTHKITLWGILIYFVFFAFRGFINTDWMTYYVEFDKCTWDLLFNYEMGKSREPGFLIFMLLNKSLVPNFHFFVFTSTLLNTWLLLSFFRKYSDNLLIALVIYLVFEGFMINANLMRNSISIFIFLNAITYLQERRPLPYFGLCLLALSFHFSAIVYFPFYFFIHRKLNKWVYLTIFVICIMIFVLHIPIFLKLIKLTGIGGMFIDNKIDAYTELSTARGFGMGFIERLITGILVFCYYEKLCDARVENRIFINSLVAFFISNFLFSEFAEISKRIYILFIYAYWILWCDLIKCFYYDRNKILFSTFVGLYCIVKTATTLNAPIHEYDNLLFGIKSYQERKYIFQKTFEEPEY